MEKISTKGLLVRIFAPTTVLSLSYLLLGYFCSIPHLLLFCILGTVTMVPLELGVILHTSKKEYGAYSFKSALEGCQKLSMWKILAIALAFFAVAGLLSVFVAPLENQLFAGLRAAVLHKLPTGFDWADHEYLRTFPRPVRVFTCVYYGIFNVLLGPITEELYFRGYLTSHYQKQGPATPILITVLFSLYHFWLPFNNVFRILAFAPVAYVSYRKKNVYISICFHCLCNVFSSVSFAVAVLA